MLAVLRAGEVAVLDPPVGDGPRDAMDKLLDAPLPLARPVFAVEVFADNDVGGKLRPAGGDFDILLLEHQLAALVLDLGAAELPVDAVERVRQIFRAELRLDAEPLRQFADRVGLGERTNGNHAGTGGRNASHAISSFLVVRVRH